MRNEIFTKTYEAEGAISPYRLVKFGAADGGVLQASAATNALIGVAKPLDEAYASGDRVEVVRAGIAEVEYGGTVTRGDNLTSDANGEAITAAYGEQIIGRAEVSGVSGDIGSVMIGSAGAAGNLRAGQGPECHPHHPGGGPGRGQGYRADPNDALSRLQLRRL